MKKSSLEQYFLRIISSRPYTRKQLVEKLVKKGGTREEAAEILDEYSRYGYVDDLIYAKLYIDSHDSWGLIRLRAELRARGVCSAVIEKAIVEEEPDELLRAEELVHSWLESEISEEKILSRLLRRGFVYSICREALDRACEQSF